MDFVKKLARVLIKRLIRELKKLNSELLRNLEETLIIAYFDLNVDYERLEILFSIISTIFQVFNSKNRKNLVLHTWKKRKALLFPH